MADVGRRRAGVQPMPHAAGGGSKRDRRGCLRHHPNYLAVLPGLREVDGLATRRRSGGCTESPGAPWYLVTNPGGTFEQEPVLWPAPAKAIRETISWSATTSPRADSAFVAQGLRSGLVDRGRGPL